MPFNRTIYPADATRSGQLKVTGAIDNAISGLNRAIIRVSDFLADAYFRAQQHRRLMELSDLGLRDIGVSRADAWAEYRKPFWRR